VLAPVMAWELVLVMASVRVTVTVKVPEALA